MPSSGTLSTAPGIFQILPHITSAPKMLSGVRLRDDPKTVGSSTLPTYLFRTNSTNI